LLTRLIASQRRCHINTLELFGVQIRLSLAGTRTLPGTPSILGSREILVRMLEFESRVAVDENVDAAHCRRFRLGKKYPGAPGRYA
jgi:hypothetical protein